jgi:hypothetical protein
MHERRNQWNAGSLAIVGLIVAMLAIVFVVFPPWTVATDSPDKAGHIGMAQLPAAIWWVGSGILAAAIIYGILHNRYRSRADVERSEEGARQVYDAEDKKDRLT